MFDGEATAWISLVSLALHIHFWYICMRLQTIRKETFARNKLFSDENLFSFYVSEWRAKKWRENLSKKSTFCVITLNWKRRKKAGSKEKIEWLMYQQWFHTISFVIQCLFFRPLKVYHYESINSTLVLSHSHQSHQNPPTQS